MSSAVKIIHIKFESRTKMNIINIFTLTFTTKPVYKTH